MLKCCLAGLAVGAFFAFPDLAWATFSIVACDDQGECGAAVATNNLAVGASVIYARADTGAIATQFETNPGYGPKGLALLAQGKSPAETLDALLASDGNFEGQDTSYRQVGIVAPGTEGRAFTGSEALASPWAGARSSSGYSVQGNGLADETVLAAMQKAFVSGKGRLAERLLTALEAGEAAGGQTTGRMSAALLARTPEGGWQDVDLRVDAAPCPVAELRHLFDLRTAQEAIGRAERAWAGGRRAEAVAAIADATRLGGSWDRIWRRVARLSMEMNNRRQAVAALKAFSAINPSWARTELADPIYRGLGTDGDFKMLRGEEKGEITRREASEPE